MTSNQKVTGTAVSIPKGMFYSGVVSLILTLLLTGILAILVEREVVEERNIGYGIMVILIVTSYISAMTAWNKIKHRRMMICLLSGIVYCVILLSITARFFGGQYGSVWETMLLIFCGSMLAVLLGGKQNADKKIGKIRKMYR